MEPPPTRVLLVEDEIGDALVVKRSLQPERGASECFDVEHASTLAQGLAALRQVPVDVLLLDLRLPDSDGPTTVARLRERDPRVPLVVFTGSDDPEVASRAFEAGADEYLVKDELQAGLLRRTIQHAIVRRRARSPGSAPSRERDTHDDRPFLLHDLKNLQTSIVGNARLLQREVGAEGFLRQRVDSLLGAARTAVELIHRLCAGAEGVQEASRLLDLSELVRRAESLLRAVLREGVDLHLDLADEPVLAAACPESIRRIVLELVVNAVEAIGDTGGRVELRTGRSLLAAVELADFVATAEIESGPHAWLEVRDDGAGFDAATRARLFERGFSTKGAGRGRGLDQVREILARHRAGLLVRGRPGHGAAFRILLPSPG